MQLLTVLVSGLLLGCWLHISPAAAQTQPKNGLGDSEVQELKEHELCAKTGESVVEGWVAFQQ